MHLSISQFVRRRVFWRDFFSYAVFLFLTILIGIIIYRFSYNMTQNQSIETRKTTLTQSQELIDNRLKEIDSIVTQLSLDQRILEAARINQPLTGKDYEKIRSLLVNFPTYRMTNDFIYDILIYFERGNFIVSDRYASTRVNLIYNEFFQFELHDFESWKQELIETNYGGKYKGANNINYRNEDLKLISYSKSIPTNNFSAYNSSIIVLINENMLHQQLSKLILDDSGWCRIQDSDGDIITSLGNESLNDDYTALNKEFSHQEININGTEVSVIHTVSAYNGWTYIAAYPTSIISEKVSYIRNIYLSFSTLFIIIGIFLALLLASKKYKPVKNLVSLMSEKNDLIHKNSDEFAFLQQSIENLITSREDLMNAGKHQFPILRAAFFEKLLKNGFKDDQEIFFMQSSLGLDLRSKYYVVSLIRTNGSEKNVSADSNDGVIHGNSSNDFKLNESTLSEELFLISNELVAIILYKDAPLEVFQEHLNQYINDLSLCLQNNLEEDFSIAIGSIQTHISEIGRSYSDAQKAFDYISFKPKMKKLWFSSLTPPVDHYQFSGDDQNKLVSLIYSGDWKSVVTELDKLYKENFSQGYLDRNSFNQLIFSICSTASNIFNDLNIDDNHCEFDTLISSLKESQNAESFYVSVSDLFYFLFDKSQQLKSDYNTVLINQILKFISEPENKDKLRLSEIADKFELSEKYLSSFFKKMTGKNISTYIENMIMKQALNLILENKLTVKQIAENIGYNNVNTFYKAFKRVHGMSPSQYKRHYNLKK